MKTKFGLSAILGVLLIGLVSYVWAADGAVSMGSAQPISGVYITPGSRAKDLSSGAHKVPGIDYMQNLLVANGTIETAWAITNATAVNATATATKAAAASTIHCLTSLDYGIWQDNTGTVSAAGGFTLAVRDGAAGVGTVVWSKTFSFPLATNGLSLQDQIVFPTPIKGTAGNALTVEFTSAVLAHTGTTVNAQGYSIK